MKKNLGSFWGVFFTALFLTFLCFEIGARSFLKPCGGCFGTLFGKELPPFKIKIAPPQEVQTSQLFLINGKPLTVEGRALTKEDLDGIRREDPVLGYVSREGVVSPNGWYRTNSIGARRDEEVFPSISQGKKRFLVFGESFTQCSGVRQEESWPFFLEKSNAQLEVVNFGVDGYSMAQAFLRYRDVRDKLDYHGVILTLVPTPDLWRDVNMWRRFGGWKLDDLMPRFEVGPDGRLTLVQRLYGNRKEFFLANKDALSARLKDFLRRHDRLYFPQKYESGSVLGGLIAYKLWTRSCVSWDLEYLKRHLMDSSSEAMAVSRQIFLKMEEDSVRRGAEFLLVILPVKADLNRFRKDPDFRRQWQDMVKSFSMAGIPLLDLMPEMEHLSAKDLDAAYDGKHFGPKTNRFIGAEIEQELRLSGLI